MVNEPSSRFGGDTGPNQFSPRRERRAIETTLGVVLIVVGCIFYAQHFLGFNPWRWGWPFAIIVPGALFLTAAIFGGRSTTGLAIPGAIISTVGTILLVQNTFHTWQTWAYAWALVVPTSIGVGIWLHGWLSDRENVQRTGRAMATIGLALFLGFAVFFELVVNLSGVLDRSARGPAIAVVLILAGTFLLLRRSDRAPTP